MYTFSAIRMFWIDSETGAGRKGGLREFRIEDKVHN